MCSTVAYLKTNHTPFFFFWFPGQLHKKASWSWNLNLAFCSVRIEMMCKSADYYIKTICRIQSNYLEAWILHYTTACPQSLIINSFGLSTCEKRGDECSNYCKYGPTGSQNVWMLEKEGGRRRRRQITNRVCEMVALCCMVPNAQHLISIFFPPQITAPLEGRWGVSCMCEAVAWINYPT